MEGINEHASDDSWCDDGLLNEISDADLNREQKRRYDQFYTMGYRDGISSGKEASAQEGFNIGFKQSASSGYKWGIVRGITSAFVNLPDQFKEKLVKKLEDRDTFQSLYMPVQEISTDDALRMHHFQLLQENKQSHERSKAKFQATTSSAIEDSDCSKLDFLFKELMLLVRESSEIKASVDAVKGEEEE